MKRLLLVLVLLMSAGSLFAAELNITGDAMVRGAVKSTEVDAPGAEAQNEAYFDYDFNVNAALKANDAATVYLKLTYDKNVDEAGKVADSDSDSTLAVERAYINYKFHPALQLNTGLMAGGQWASNFNNDEINVMRVQAIGALSKDMIFIATVQKNNENGTAFEDKESYESDSYYLSSKMVFGAITVLPLFTYVVDGASVEGSTLTQQAFTLGVNGDFGMVGLESEFYYVALDSDDVLADDPTLYGAYVNVFAKVAEGVKVGVAGAYASSDEDSGFSAAYGGDFDFTMVVDDWGWGSEGGLQGMMSGKVYFEAAVMPKLTVDGAFAYGVQVDDAVVKYNTAGPLGAFATMGQAQALGAEAAALAAEAAALGVAGEAYGAAVVGEEAAAKAAEAAALMTNATVGSELSFWEVDLGVTYAIDENTAYRIAGGYAVMEADEVETTNYRVEHKFSVKF